MRKHPKNNLPTLINLAPSDWSSEIKTSAGDRLPTCMEGSHLAVPQKKVGPYVKRPPLLRQGTETFTVANTGQQRGYSLFAAMADRQPHAQPTNPYILQAWNAFMRLARGTAVLVAILLVGAELWPHQRAAATIQSSSTIDQVPAPVDRCEL
jgi:hypothetical protein